MGNEIVNRCPNCGDHIDRPGFCGVRCMREYHYNPDKDRELTCNFCYEEYFESNSTAIERNKYCSVECEKKDKQDEIEDRYGDN